jgi:hypothetical protein
VSAAGSSAEEWGRELRAHARRGVWRRVLSLLGVTAHTRAADAKAANCAAGARGEQLTAIALAPLEAVGWTVLHDRRIPGARTANADHVVVSPGKRVYVIDSKLRSAKTGTVHARGERLWHGDRPMDRDVDSLRFEAMLVEKALGVPVQPLMCVHNAPVAGGRFIVRDVPVLPADALAQLLVLNDGRRDPGAVVLGRRAAVVLPPYLR